jgi:hypothetical protein
MIVDKKYIVEFHEQKLIGKYIKTDRHDWFNMGKYLLLSPIKTSKIPFNRWTHIKCAVKLLSLHKNSVVRANCPLKKFERGEFELF